VAVEDNCLLGETLMTAQTWTTIQVQAKTPTLTGAGEAHPLVTQLHQLGTTGVKLKCKEILLPVWLYLHHYSYYYFGHQNTCYYSLF
jgi:hypothetical protein